MKLEDWQQLKVVLTRMAASINCFLQLSIAYACSCLLVRLGDVGLQGLYGTLAEAPLYIQVEAELQELEEAEATEYLQSLGVQEGGLRSLINATYKQLGLLTYFTTGDLDPCGPLSLSHHPPYPLPVFLPAHMHCPALHNLSGPIASN